MRKREMTTLLGQINRIRVACQIADGSTIEGMPKGIPSDAAHCPIATALSNGVTAEVDGALVELYFPNRKHARQAADNLRAARFRNVLVEFQTVEFRCTAAMVTFIDEFDAEKMPELIAGKALMLPPISDVDPGDENDYGRLDIRVRIPSEEGLISTPRWASEEEARERFHAETEEP